MAIPNDPLTRGEQYLAKMAREDVTLPDEPLTRMEQYLAKIAGQDVAIPDVPLTRVEQYLDYIAENGGSGGDITLETLNVSSNGTTNAPTGKAYNKVVASVPNSYSAGDEGKVVSGGSLVSQTAHAQVTQNGTVDTTLNNSVEVAVPQPSGTKQISITQNGTTTENVAAYASAEISVSVSGGGGDLDKIDDFTGGNILAIVGHGTEYIQTDYLPPMEGFFGTKFKDTTSTPSYEHYWGAGDSHSPQQRIGLQRAGTYLQALIGYSQAIITTSTYSKGEVTEVYTTSFGNASGVANKELCFYKGYKTNVSSLESQVSDYTFYGLNILNANLEMVARFVPWLQNGVACIKELISGTIYTNTGTGAFDYIDLEGVTHVV